MGSGFMCGWCAGSCEVTSECSNTLVTVRDDCPAPIIHSFHPTSGKAITVEKVVTHIICMEHLTIKFIEKC